MRFLGLMILILSAFSLNNQFSWEYLAWLIVALLLLLPHDEIIKHILRSKLERKRHTK